MADVELLPCGECGMPCRPGEYHPFAACLMFKACHNSDTVRANLAPLQAEIEALREALEQCITSMLDSGYRADAVVIRAARAALAAEQQGGAE